VCGPLNCCTPGVFVNSECSRSVASSWVLQKMEDIHHCVGLSSDGFEGEFMALLTAIETSHNWGESVSNSKSANRGKRELKRLPCSINYDSMGGSSSRSRVKGVV